MINNRGFEPLAISATTRGLHGHICNPAADIHGQSLLVLEQPYVKEYCLLNSPKPKEWINCSVKNLRILTSLAVFVKLQKHPNKRFNASLYVSIVSIRDCHNSPNQMHFTVIRLPGTVLKLDALACSKHLDRQTSATFLMIRNSARRSRTDMQL